MKHSILAAAMALPLAGCGQQQNASAEANAPAAETAETYSGAGKVTAIAGDQVSIAHGPIPGIGWPAMTMRFTAPNDMAAGVKVKSRVEFSFWQDGSTYVLTSTKRI